MRRENGTATVELVLLAPALLVVLLFIVGVGRITTAAQQVSSIAGDAARAASLERNTSLAAQRGREMAEQSLGERGISCDSLVVEIDISDYEPGGAVRAEVTCATRLSDVLIAGFPGRHTYTRTATVPIETWRSR